MDRTQMRMARTAFGWSTHELAKRAGVARITVARFEAGESVAKDSLLKIEQALMLAGAQFSRRSGRIGVSVPDLPVV